VTIILPRGKRGYALRYCLPGGGTAQPSLPAGMAAADVVTAAVQLSALLRLGVSMGAATPAPARPRAKEDGQAHRGVQVIPPRPGRAYYALRYTDPATRKCRQSRLAGVTTQADAHAAAIAMHRSLQQRALAVTLAGGPEHAATAVTLREEASTYVTTVRLKVSKHGRSTAASTIRSYRDSLEAFAAWCDTRSVARLSHLSRDVLSGWLASRQAAPAHGRVRKVSTVNQEVKPVRQMLVAAAQAGRLVHLSSDAIRGALKRLTQPAPKPRCLSVPEIRATLQAALDYDMRADRPKGGKHMTGALAPAVAVALLSGMRRRELSELQCGEVLFNACSQFDPAITTGHDLIDLPGHKTKTGAPRGVLLAPYSPLLGQLLHALAHGRPKTHRVFGIGYQALGDAVWKLRQYGAPADLNVKMLRSTCATCQRPLPGDLKSKAERLGHTLAVAEAYYLAAPTGLPVSAPNLETVMQCAPEVREVLARVHTHRKGK
jgi:integrase